MIWAIKPGDVISFPNDLYHYEVKSVSEEFGWLENLLEHTFREVRISTIKEEAKIERRCD